ncbi:MAG: protein kinase [Acidobacteria bacterium]|nr:protein kinase [Acidobacteriota bacterium]
MERIGRYEIISELGRGAMGVVYRARDPKIDRELAIKTIKLSEKVDSSEVQALRERLFREAQSAGKLSHPNIVTVYDVDEDGDTAYIAMELVEGKTLEQALRKGPIRDLALAAGVLRQAAAALDYAHSRGIIHRDVKPGNLMLGAEGVVKIMDFGIARIGSSNLTQTGSVLGTPSYMSPEQVKGEELDGASDQFSLGVIAYEMLAGQKPFPGENLTAVIFKIVSKEPPPLAEHCPGASPELEAVVFRALSKAPSERFADCKAFAEAFEEVARGIAAPAFEAGETQAISALDEGESAEEEFGTAETQVAMTSTAGAKEQRPQTETSKLPPLRRDAAVAFEDEEPKQGWGVRVAVGVAAALLLAAAGVAIANPSIFSDPRGPVAGLRAWWTGEEADGERERPSYTMTAEPPLSSPAPIVAEEPETPAPTPATTEQPPASEPGENAPKAAEAKAPEEKPAEASPPAEKPAEPEPQKAKVEAPPTPQPKAAAKPAPTRKVPVRKSEVESVAVYFRTTPRGARIMVDDRPDWVCESPCQITDLPPGQHQVTAKLDGYYPAQRTVSLGSSAQAVLEIKLEDARITALITSEPTGADIYIDGRKTGQRTNAKVPLARGTYQVKVVKEGVGEAEQVMVVDKDQIPYAKFILHQGQ